MRVHLTTARLVLREFDESDLEHLVELDSDPSVMGYISGGVPTPGELIRNEVLPRFLQSYGPHDGFGIWAVLKKSGGGFVGRASLELAAHSTGREARLGYRLLKSHWSKGYATEISLALIRTGFVDLGLDRILASTYEHNVASRRVMEKSGMTLVKRYRPTVEELAEHASSSVAASEVWEGDEVEYAVDRSEWELRQKR
jgi:RimJ/RimL family protein N-acetyltransferase